MSLLLQNVRHSYALTEVLGGVGLALSPGRVLALVGPSGCGKTTLLHLCAGLLAVQEGALHNGFARTAVMFQQALLLPWLSTLDNIALGLKARGMPRAARQQQARAQAAALGLDALALRQYPHQLSGGMQSRAALARALVQSPDALLLDEPFAALDIGLKAHMHRLLQTQRVQRSLGASSGGWTWPSRPISAATNGCCARPPPCWRKRPCARPLVCRRWQAAMRQRCLVCQMRMPWPQARQLPRR